MTIISQGFQPSIRLVLALEDELEPGPEGKAFAYFPESKGCSDHVRQSPIALEGSIKDECSSLTVTFSSPATT
jgi:hypothetical protein